MNQILRINEIMSLQKEISGYEYDNFLSPDVLHKFKETNYKQSFKLIKDLGRRKIWQPDRFHVSKKSDFNDVPLGAAGS